MRAFLSILGAILASWAMPLAAEDDAPARCPDARTTLDLDECTAAILETTRARRAQYLAAAVQRHAETPELGVMIAASDVVFDAYARSECDAVYVAFIDGSIRNIMTLTCQIALNDQRTHTIWRNWLTYMDSTKPDLPEPLPTP